MLAAGLWMIFLELAVPVQASKTVDVEEKIRNSFVTEKTADLSEEGITTDELKQIASELLYAGKLPWYADWYACSYDRATGLVVEFFPRCLDKSVYDRELYEEAVAKILSETVHEGMQDWQIALAIHDYLAANFSYDETLTHDTGYDLLVGGKAVCSGYAGAYMDLMNRAGVPCTMVLSDEMGHGWNMVQLGGQWYHVDVTWDDPIPDVPGNVCHDFFLKTDEEIGAEPGAHYGWGSEISCRDERFSDGFWQGIDRQICYVDAHTYMIDGVEYQESDQARQDEQDQEVSLHQLLELLLSWLGLRSSEILTR